MKTYKFDGNWEFQVALDSLNKFSFEKTKATTKIIIRDFPTDDLAPYKEQIDCINYILQNQQQLKQTILNAIWKNWDDIKEIHELDEWEDFPTIATINDLFKVVRIDEIYIQPLHKDKISYFGILGDCLWDEEHGLGLVLHRNRVIEFGGAEEADAGGGETGDSPDNQRPEEPNIPKLYNAHPKYGTLKPYHKEANIDYPHKLIKRGLNQEFTNYFLNNPNPDFIHPEDWQKRTYLQTACVSNNVHVFNMLLPIAKNLTKTIYNAHLRRNISFIEKLVKKGADIHETHFGTSILTDAVEQHLRIIAVNLTEEEMNTNHQRMLDYYNKEDVNNFFPRVLKEMKMHPREKIKKSRKYIEMIIRYGVALDEERISYAKHNNRDNVDAHKAIDKEVEWIKEKL